MGRGNSRAREARGIEHATSEEQGLDASFYKPADT